MADLKISQLTGATPPLTGTETVPLVQGGLTKKVSVANLTAGRAVASAGGTFSDNYIQGTAAKGINFTANTPAAGVTSQLLNWYEEGTFTAALTPASGSISLSIADCKYTRIGNRVSVSGFLYVESVSTPSGALTITGLPFAAAAGFPAYSAASIYTNFLTTAATSPLMGYISGGSTSINITGFTAGSVVDASAFFKQNSHIAFEITYTV